jgi:hypothetical protein
VLNRQERGNIWGMHGCFEEPSEFREESESSINTTPVLSGFDMVGLFLKKEETLSM